MTETKAPQSGKELRKQLTDQYGLEDADELALLDTACHSLDTALAAEAQVKKEGLVVASTRGTKPHPAISIANSARHQMMKALKALNLTPRTRRDY